MSDPGLRQSPLSEFFTEFNPNMVRPEVGISITEKPFLGYLNLRAEPDAEMITLIEQASGIRLPIEQNTFTRNARTDAIWLGPDEWLLVMLEEDAAASLQSIHNICRDRFYSITDITHGNTTIHLYGPNATQLLNKGCSLDLSHSVLRPGSCAQTLLAKANVIIRLADSSPSFDLIVRRSFAEYLALWLTDASLEYGFENLNRHP